MKNEKFNRKDKKGSQTVSGVKLKLKSPWADCERQRCSCSKPDTPVFRYQCENGKGCKKFNRLDFGCYQLSIGKKPVRKCMDDCICNCHPKDEVEEE